MQGPKFVPAPCKVNSRRKQKIRHVSTMSFRRWLLYVNVPIVRSRHSHTRRRCSRQVNRAIHGKQSARFHVNFVLANDHVVI